MKTYLISIVMLLPFAACGGDDGPNTGSQCGAGTTEVGGECVADAVCGSGTTLTDGMCLPDPAPTPVFHQIEHLGRPGINEALLITDAFLEGYNATAPSFAGVPQATLDQVVGQAKTVLKALYLGGCLLNGVLPGVTADTGVHPAGATCAEIGGAMFSDGDALTGETLTTATADAASAYADRVFAQFELDVMRIDTSGASSYLTLCGSPLDSKPLLCGGRKLNDDVIDVTYSYLLNGAATTAGPPNDGVAGQVRALTTDGVVFDTVNAANNALSLTEGDPTNPEQGHVAVTDTFPYSGKPL